MESLESCVPPGFRFHPTDEELVGYYLKKKVASQKIDLDVIRDIDLYRIEPWDLQDTCKVSISPLLILPLLYKIKPVGFGIVSIGSFAISFAIISVSIQLVLMEEGWVVCRAFKKRLTGQTKSIGGWEPTYFYDDPSGVSSVMDRTRYLMTQPHNFTSQDFTCKEETESENLNFTRLSGDQFLQLPQLESPSQLPLMERPSPSISRVSKNNEEEDDRIIRGCNKNTKKVTTDWRELDRFVASQLSQEDRFGSDGNGMSSFGEEKNSSDMAVVRLLQSGGEEAHKFNNGFFISSPRDCDIGI
ncbi:hypothetical protein U1Q18_011572 [Sarracenia purpurea var. burkii]